MGNFSLIGARQCGEGSRPITVVVAKQAVESASQPSREELIALATQIYDFRQTRSRFLPEALLGEPVWDILLALYSLPADKPKLSVSKLCHAANIPTTTGLRWEQLMAQNELVERDPDPRDGRRFFVSLSAKGEQFLDQILTPLWCELVRDETGARQRRHRGREART